jgi:hypothetical protein
MRENLHATIAHKVLKSCLPVATVVEIQRRFTSKGFGSKYEGADKMVFEYPYGVLIPVSNALLMSAANAQR